MSRKIIAGGICGAVVVALLVFWLAHPKKKEAAIANPAPAAVAVPPDPMQVRVDDIVARYRKTIVLLEDDDSLPETDRENASLVGRIIFQENHEDISGLSDELTSAIVNAGDWSQAPAGVVRFLDLVEAQADLHDADKLVFRELFQICPRRCPA